MISVPVCKLIEDMSIYPRHAVDDANVSGLINALRAGATLPPVVVEAKSLRIVDGWHRARAYRRVIGPDAVVDVEEKTYESEEALLLDAIQLNAAHGRRLDKIDQIRVATLCAERGIALVKVAAVLHMPAEKVERLSVQLARAPESGPGTITGTVQVALKRPVVHLAGQNLTAEQVKAHQRAPGVSYLLIANQLADAIHHGFINQADERLMVALRGLYEGLGGFLAEPSGE
jgi:hypothetical protein